MSDIALVADICYNITMSKTYSKVCKFCGETFEAKAYNGLYCSSKCRNKELYRRNPNRYKEWRAKNVERERGRAREYHLEKMKDPSYVARKRRNARDYRERNPLAAARYHDTEHFGGNKLPTMERDNFTCQICMFAGDGYIDRKLSVHHKDGDRKNNDMENLITLCDRCHKILTGLQVYRRFLKTTKNKRLVIELSKQAQ